MLGSPRPQPFREDVANAAIPGFVTAYGSPARGRLLQGTKNARGLAKAKYVAACSRCGGAGGADKWAHTGWSCFDCAGTGAGPERTATIYTPEAYEKLEARRAKAAEKKRLAEEAAEAERRAPYLAWATRNAHVLAQISEHSKRSRMDYDPQLVDRIEADGRKFVISPDWMIDSAIERILRAAVYADIKAASGHVGEVGKRLDLRLTCEKVLSFGDQYQPFYIALLRDEAGNRIVYKGGRPFLGEGETGSFRVTVKEHGERDGEKQTVVARALCLDPASAS